MDKDTILNYSFSEIKNIDPYAKYSRAIPQVEDSFDIILPISTYSHVPEKQTKYPEDFFDAYEDYVYNLEKLKIIYKTGYFETSFWSMSSSSGPIGVPSRAEYNDKVEKCVNEINNSYKNLKKIARKYINQKAE